MEEQKRRRYQHLYEQDTAEPDTVPQAEEKQSAYLKDLKEIENICSRNDLGDSEANGRLYRHLRKENGFSSWIGEAFLAGLLDRTSRERRRRRLARVFRRIAVSFLAMAVVLLGVLLYVQIREAQESAVLDYIRKEKEQLARPEEEKNDENEAQPLDILSQYAIIYSMYPDFVGWLTVEGTGIDDPVMQDRSGEDYYLKHSFEGREDSKGSLFVDADSCVNPQDKSLVIYGHNVSDGSQFGNLDYYLDPDFYEKHSTFTFDTVYETGSYQIVAVVKTRVKQESESGFRYYWMHGYENRGEFQELLDFISEGSLYDTGEHLTYGDSVVMLSTCEYTVDNGRLVIIAKRIE